MVEKMDKKEIVEVMDDLLAGLRDLQDAAFKKQRALIANKYDQLETALAREEKILGNLQLIQKRRSSLLEEFKSELALSVNHNKFGEFLKAIKGKVNSDFFELLMNKNTELGFLLSDVNLLNLQNRYLTEQVRSFNRSLINELFGNKKKTLLDKKI